MKPILFLLFLLAGIRSAGQIITTVAGNGTYGFGGDGGPALNAQLGEMYHCYPAFDNLGNMYIAQDGLNVIRKIDVSGTITTIAGRGGVTGYTGDGGPAVNALLSHPTSIAVDNNNNIYFTDYYGSVIRKINPAGIITTITGPYATPCGIGDGGPVAQARFRAISAISIDQFNNLYVSDYGCNTVRKISASGIVTTIAGNGSSGFSGDGGLATQAQMDYPLKVAVDNAGNVYIPDARNHRIRKVNTAGIITTVAGTGVGSYSGDGGPATAATLFYPGSVVIDNSGNLYIGDDYNYVIRKIDGAGIITTYAGNRSFGYSGDGGPALMASIAMTNGLISIYNNDIYLSNYLIGNVIRKISNCLTASIQQQPQDVGLCGSGNATFSIGASNTSGYAWQQNTGSGWTNLTNNGTYSGVSTGTLMVSGATAAMNNFQYRCVLASGCGPVFSRTVLLSVTAPVTPSLTVTTSATAICQGTPVVFTAVALNGGASPLYQWKKNGVNVGTNANAYTDNALIDGDAVSCTLTPSGSCTGNNPVNSNAIVMSVTSPVTPAITISASANNICSGTPVTFTSSVTNGGSAPSLTWFKNNVSVLANAPVYTANALNDGDVITCSLTSSLSCVAVSTVLSLPITMSVTPLAVPSLNITASGNAVCRNAQVFFSATSANGGSNPMYQWKKNGLPTGSNASSYADNMLVNGDVITCTLTSNLGCVTTPQAVSNSLSIVVYPDPVVALDKTNSLCEGSTRLLDAGTFSAYLWNTGSTGRTLAINRTGRYEVTVTDANGCTGSDFTQVTTMLPSPAGFLPGDTAVCSYGSVLLKAGAVFPTYLWSTGSVNPFITITQAGRYWLQVKNSEGCTGADTVTVLSKDCLKGFFMPTAFTPNNDGKNDFIKPFLLGDVKQYEFRIYNRWGQLVFQTTDPLKSWDGNYRGGRQDASVFVWTCTYQFQGEVRQMEKGTLVLIR